MVYVDSNIARTLNHYEAIHCFFSPKVNARYELILIARTFYKNFIRSNFTLSKKIAARYAG